MAECTQPPLWLYVHVTGRTNQADLEDQIPRAIAMAAPEIDGIYLFVPPWQQAPDILHTSIARRVVDACDLFDLNLVLCRQLWITHGDQQLNTDHVTSAYYVSAMQRLDAESEYANASGTCLDVEPYGGPMVDAFKTGVTISRELHLRIAEAIERACQYAPRPTFVTPWGHRIRDHWHWAFLPLATNGLIQSSYRVRDPDHPYMGFTPPVSHSFSVTHPGWWVVPEVVLEHLPISRPLTVNEFRDLDWADWRLTFPDIEAAWLYVDRKDLLAVCRQLGKGV